jgi:beta-glucosidase
MTGIYNFTHPIDKLINYNMKKKLLNIGVALLLLAGCTSKQKVEPVIPRDAEIEKRVEATLKKMTLEEKVGQMTQLNITSLGHNDFRTGKFILDEDKLETIFGKYKVGSILNNPSSVPPTNREWTEIMTTIQKWSMESMGIPCIMGLDQNHGTTYTSGGTMFPQNINMAATFNTDAATRAASITAYETRSANVTWTFCPTMDLSRDQRWPRAWENFGEDAYLNAAMGSAATRGFQGENPNNVDDQHIAVSIKHYMGYGVPVSGKDRTPAVIAPNELREKHFAPYLAAIKAGALTVMVNSGMINGVMTHANHELLTVWLKEQTGWDGMIVTDWADIDNLYKRDKIAKDKKEAIKMAINAGIDMSMDPYSTDFCDLLLELVNEGEVPMSRIDDAVRRVLRLKYRLGLFDKLLTNPDDYPKFACNEFAQFATEAAEESMVLLKNNGILPLAKGKKILLTGPNANSMRTLNGGWSYSWQGDMADVCAADYNTIYESFVNKFGKENVILEQGVTYNNRGSYWQENAPEIEKAVRAAAKADIIVACIGENSYCETPGNLSDLTLSRNQLDLVKALAKTGKPIVLILNEGRARIIAEIEPLADAVVDIMLPGNYGGDALANLLNGDANFSGRLPFTYPKEVHSLITYDYKPCQEMDAMEGAYNYDAVVSVQWAFGYGKSYTTYEYSNLKVDNAEFTADDMLTFTVDVKNTGKMAGKESVLLFSSDLVATISPDVRRLRAFDKIELQPGETKTVTLTIPASDLAFVGADGKWILEEGDFRVQVGNQLVNLNCTETYKWETPNI